MTKQTRNTSNRQTVSRRAPSLPPGEQRIEAEIIEDLRQDLEKVIRSEDEKLRLHRHQGGCILEAADPIREAGGTEKWLAKHHVGLGIPGKSRTAAANVAFLAKATYEECHQAIVWASANEELLRTNRVSGIDYFVIVLRRYRKREHLPSVPQAKRLSKPDRERILLASQAQKGDWIYRLLADLEKACADGWNPRVLNAIRFEMEHAASDNTDNASNIVSITEGNPAHAVHHSAEATDAQVGSA